MKKISVIVPVYNVENYLSKCIESILNQTYSNIELILVDDGSTDNSPQICDEYSKKDNRVIVLHKKNGGAAAARNSGIEIATGEYIAFVDSDDYIELNMYSQMMDINNQYGCDMVMCDCVKESKNSSQVYSHNIRSGYYNKQQLVDEYYSTLLMTNDVNYPPTISNCVILFKKCLIDKNNIRYVEGMRFSEDLLFGSVAAYFADSFYYMKNVAFYHYIMNPNSVTNSTYVDKWSLLKMLYSHIDEFFSNIEDYDFTKQIYISLLFFVYLSISSIRNSNLNQSNKIKMMKNILNDSDVKSMFKNLDLKTLDISKKLLFITLLYKYRIGIRFLCR